MDRLKEEGNVAFKGGKLQEAVDKYSEALEVCFSDLENITLAHTMLPFIADRRERGRGQRWTDTRYAFVKPSDYSC